MAAPETDEVGSIRRAAPDNRQQSAQTQFTEQEIIASLCLYLHLVHYCLTYLTAVLKQSLHMQLYYVCWTCTKT